MIFACLAFPFLFPYSYLRRSNRYPLAMSISELHMGEQEGKKEEEERGHPLNAKLVPTVRARGDGKKGRYAVTNSVSHISFFSLRR